ncbi:uncharacterized protein LOC125061018 [Pieris napi]|uniref:uncharacterized protein LOC125061018 n=1 Tax=Pieris napi TaxID=78633 RepID=UPI001FBC036E|nr:uncharacterized protein LOC125061018 [Pieris napi]
MLVLFCLLQFGAAIMIKKECPYNEMYRSCSFTEEFTCWESEEMAKRVMSLPERLPHCKSGCYCKRGFVRAYPSSQCIPAVTCRDRNLELIIGKLPDMLIDF